ncbi:myosin heavy chain kinase D-like isoform X2 [Anthonomus grandis grandis]|uniref:myosin heavy chain kinase D-like isoform X2 n=1 Tax=Anthonomus grandis grandis TaxID=2921223 RepID=UPI002166C061|nr:myosin heavy chain kinase D-like isoform X2 [Anthonomus grandis grandis]
MSLKVSCRASDSDKHEWDITHLLFHKGKLYSAADDGKIKLWSKDLIKEAEAEAHPCSVFCLAANDDTLYSCSNDGTIKMWDLNTLKEKGILVQSSDVEYWRVGYSAGCLFAGDDKGNISVYKDNQLYGQVNIAEPIKDMVIHDTLVFTVKDLDLVITEIKLEGKNIKYGTKISFMGRAPVTLIGDKLFAFITREGKEIQLHEICVESGFKPVARMTGSEMIINALSGTVWNDQQHLFSGGWDKMLKWWSIKNNGPTQEATCNVDLVITSIQSGDNGQVFVGGADGHILRIDVV